MTTTDFTTNDNPDVYYAGKYWNDLVQVRARINSKIAGRPELQPEQHFFGRYGEGRQRALILNCGNGWVERGLLEQGFISEAVGIDYSTSLLDEARSLASRAGLAAQYVQMDVNSAKFPTERFDLVVNWAAGHHIAYLDKVFRELCRLLPEDGWMLSFDYVGPHRNQYSAEAWEEAWRVNLTLPEHLRQEMHYPHLPTMLATDPTEAIHSELVLVMFRRYFTVEELVPLGGAVAYPLLTFNEGFFAAEGEAERAAWVTHVLEADEAFLSLHRDSSLFAYFTGRPKKQVLDDERLLAEWTAEELDREAAGSANGGEYYPRTALQTAYLDIEELHRAAEHLHGSIREREAELHRIRASVPYQLARRMSTSGPARALRSQPMLARQLERVRRRMGGSTSTG